MGKKHTSKFLMILLAICLITSIVLFVACNPSDGDGDTGGTSKEPYEQFTTTMFNEVLANLGSSFSAGETFGFDIAAIANVDDKTEKNADVSYNLVVKGNIDVKSAETEKSSNMFLELVESKGQNKRTILGIGYEYIDGSPFLFVNILDDEYHKITGYSAASLYSILSGIDLSSISSVGGINITSILAQLLFGQTGTIDGETYIFNFDLANLFGTVEKFLPLLSGAIGISTADIDAVIGMIFGGVTYEKDGETVSVNSLATLGEYVKTGMSFKGTVTFKFDNKKFVSANASFDYEKGGSAQANYSLDVPKVVIGAMTTPVNVFETFPMDAAARADAKFTNLLNFQLNGQAIGYGSSGDVKKRYDASLNMDIDPFALLDLLKSDAPSIPSVLKRLGYFNLTVDAFNADGTEAGNVLTIHSKFDEGFLIVNFDLHDAPGNPLAVGGVYEFEALIDVIGLLMNPASDGAETETEGETEESAGIDIMALIGDIFGMIEYEDITNNGLTIDVLKLRLYILNMLGMGNDNTLKTAANFLFDNAVTMNFKVFDAAFGTCQYVETSTIENTMRKVKGFENKDFIKEVTAITNLREVEQGSPNLNMYVGDVFEFDKFFEINGINLKGEEITTTGYIMWSDLDTSYAGDQEVTFYIGIGNEIYSTIKSMGLDDLIPLFGAHKFVTTVTVLPYEQDSEVTLGVNDTREFLASAYVEKGATLFDSLLPDPKKSTKVDFTIGSGDNARTYALDASYMTIHDLKGNDVTDKVLKNGKLKKAGYFKVRFSYLGYSKEIDIAVDALYAVFADESEIPDTYTLGSRVTMNFKIVEELADGTKTVTDYNDIETEDPARLFTFKVGSTTFLYNFFDGLSTTEKYATAGKTYYFMKKGNLLANPAILITFKDYESKTLGKKSITMESKLVAPENAPESYSKTSSYLYPNSNANGLYSFVSNGKTYLLKYDVATATWYAATEDGEKYQYPIEISVYYLDGTNKVPLILNENGTILNIPLAGTTAGSGKTATIQVEIAAFDIAFIGSGTSEKITMRGLYATNNTKHKITDTLSSMQYLNNMKFSVDGAEKDLEFKYSAALGKYGIFVKGTDMLAYEVSLKITDPDGVVSTSLENGLFTKLGMHKVEYTVNIDGVELYFFNNVDVKAA